jgi:hypothetical protein
LSDVFGLAWFQSLTLARRKKGRASLYGDVTQQVILTPEEWMAQWTCFSIFFLRTLAHSSQHPKRRSINVFHEGRSYHVRKIQAASGSLRRCTGNPALFSLEKTSITRIYRSEDLSNLLTSQLAFEPLLAVTSSKCSYKMGKGNRYASHEHHSRRFTTRSSKKQYIQISARSDMLELLVVLVHQGSKFCLFFRGHEPLLFSGRSFFCHAAGSVKFLLVRSVELLFVQ